MKKAKKKEIWKVIPGFKSYSISDNGHIRSYIQDKAHGRIMSPKIVRGNMQVVLKGDKGEKKSFLMHKLVANLFIPNRKGFVCVLHRDGDRQNNAKSNLRWSTHKDIIKHYSKLRKTNPDVGRRLAKQPGPKLVNLKGESWKSIVDYGAYYISNKGRVKSFLRDKISGRIMRPIQGISQHPNITLIATDGKHKTFYIHKLVSLAFVSNPHAKPFVRHKDGNPSNNVWTNLEWVNRKDLYKLGHIKPVNAKIGESEAIIIKDLLAKKVVGTRIAEMFGISAMQVSRIKSGENWAWVTG